MLRNTLAGSKTWFLFAGMIIYSKKGEFAPPFQESCIHWVRFQKKNGYSRTARLPGSLLTEFNPSPSLCKFSTAASRVYRITGSSSVSEIPHLRLWSLSELWSRCDVVELELWSRCDIVEFQRPHPHVGYLPGFFVCLLL